MGDDAVDGGDDVECVEDYGEGDDYGDDEANNSNDDINGEGERSAKCLNVMMMMIMMCACRQDEGEW